MELKRGQIAVDKKRLTEHLKMLNKAVKYLDKAMNEPESKERGEKVAKFCNAIEFSVHTIEHFDLNMPLGKHL